MGGEGENGRWRGVLAQRAEILGGNADDLENKGVAEIATQKILKRKGLKIDCWRNPLRFGGTESWREKLAE
jgi:hypothetical protein